MIKKFILAFVALICTVASIAQNFEGKMTAKIVPLQVPAEMEGMKAMFNQDITTYIKGAKTKAEIKSAMGTQMIIFDSIAKEVTVLTDMMGQKFAMTQKVENSSEANTTGFDLSGAKIERTGETKKIAGYNCKKAIATIVDEETKESIKVEFWFTEEINAGTTNLPFKGTMMEYVMNIEGMSLQFTITAISKEAVSASVFNIPEGYQIMTPEQMQGMMPTMGNE